jgi:hypothetical protein
MKSESRYNPQRTREGDCFNQDPPAIEVEYDTGNKLSEQQRDVAQEAKENLEND